MSDVKFQFYAVPNRYQDVIQRMAVLYPLRGQASDADGVRRHTQDLLDQWRARIGALTSAGWEPRQGSSSNHSILYARNCIPTFAITGHRTRCCMHKLICPFCYARWTRDIWRSIDADFPVPDPVEPTPEETEAGRELRSIMLDTDVEEQPRAHQNVFRFHLVERHHYFFRPVLPEDNSQGITLAQNLAGLLNNIEEGRSRLVSLVDPIGAFVYTTLEPWNQGQQWRIHHRQIFKLLPGQDIPEEIVASTTGRITRFQRPTRKDILKVVARVCSYPKGLITGSAERTVQLLAVRRAINFRGYGRFRSFRTTTEYE